MRAGTGPPPIGRLRLEDWADGDWADEDWADGDRGAGTGAG
jgi:hypothetical protein